MIGKGNQYEPALTSEEPEQFMRSNLDTVQYYIFVIGRPTAASWHRGLF